MGDRCEKCGRENANIRGQNLTHCTGDWLCEFATEAYRRGLREGVELATDLLRDYPPDCYWRDVDAELERRLK